MYGDDWDIVSTYVESRSAVSVMRHYHNFFRKMEESFNNGTMQKKGKWTDLELQFYTKVLSDTSLYIVVKLEHQLVSIFFFLDMMRNFEHHRG